MFISSDPAVSSSIFVGAEREENLMRGKSFFQTRKPVHASEFLRVIRYTDYVLLKSAYIDFLLEKIRTFKKLRAIEVYVYERVVLMRVGLYNIKPTLKRFDSLGKKGGSQVNLCVLKINN